MRVLIAPDKFKGSLTAREVADSLARGLVECGAVPMILPLADGGDGSVAAALASGMRAESCEVTDALGRRHIATIALDGMTAVVEVANTCGLSTLDSATFAPMTASSYGFGEAVRYAMHLYVQRIVLALGGSASTDGGSGLLQALGFTFEDRMGRPVRPTPAALPQIHRVRSDHAVDLGGVDLVIASDVTNPLLGPTGAAAVFGPQKGASAADVEQLEAAMSHLVSLLARSGLDIAHEAARAPGAGAAGGIGFAALCLGGRIVSGADYFLDLLDFDSRIRQADLVVTGEGCLDEQTFAGKLPAVVAQRSGNTPVIAIAGRNTLSRPAPLFFETHAVADLSDTDTSRDSHRTALILESIGRDLGQRWQHLRTG